MATKVTQKPATAVRRARPALSMSIKDFARLQVLRAKKGLTWQDMLTQAMNEWLALRGEKELEK